MVIKEEQRITSAQPGMRTTVLMFRCVLIAVASASSESQDASSDLFMYTGLGWVIVYCILLRINGKGGYRRRGNAHDALT